MSQLKLKNCPECGHAFQEWGGTLCPSCTLKNRREFEAVKAHLRAHQGASIEETTRETGVEVGTILRWIRDGQLVLKS